MATLQWTLGEVQSPINSLFVLLLEVFSGLTLDFFSLIFGTSTMNSTAFLVLCRKTCIPRLSINTSAMALKRCQSSGDWVRQEKIEIQQAKFTCPGQSYLGFSCPTGFHMPSYYNKALLVIILDKIRLGYCFLKDVRAKIFYMIDFF